MKVDMDLDITKLKPNISVGDTQILDSGCLLVTYNETTVFKFSIPDGTFLIFKFRFAKDENKTDENGNIKSGFEYKIKDEHGEKFLDIVFTNMDDVAMAGNFQKVKFAIILGHPITFKFRLSSVGQDPVNYVFNYTWYLETEKDNITMY